MKSQRIAYGDLNNGVRCMLLRCVAVTVRHFRRVVRLSCLGGRRWWTRVGERQDLTVGIQQFCPAEKKFPSLAPPTQHTLPCLYIRQRGGLYICHTPVNYWFTTITRKANFFVVVCFKSQLLLRQPQPQPPYQATQRGIGQLISVRYRRIRVLWQPNRTYIGCRTFNLI